MNAAEYTGLGVVLMKYRDAVDAVDASLLLAAAISAPVDPDKAASIEACRLALLSACDVVDRLLADRPRRES